MWVEGEPGIGKTVLAGLLADRASARGLGVLQGSADELMTGFPLRLMAGCLGVSRRSDASSDVDAVRTEITALLRGDADGRLVADPVLAAGERMLDLVDRLCARRPQVLIMDDLHWADEPSLRLWGRLADSVDQIPLLLVGLSRTVSEPAVLERLRDRVRRGGVLLNPGPLEGPQVRELAGRIVGATPGPGLLAEIARAQGNPLYVVELAEALRREGLIAPVGRPGAADGADRAQGGAARVEFTGRPGTTPDSLATVIGARLGYLDVRVRTTLRLAALLGTEFSVAQLARLAGLAPAELITVLAAAQEAGVVGPGTHGLAFRHVLIQQVLIEQTPEAVRDALHGEIALRLAGTGADLDAVARHLLAFSGPLEPWAVTWLHGVPAAAFYGAPQVADELLSRALEAVSKADPVWLALAANLAHARFWRGLDRSAVEIAREVAQLSPDIDGRARMWTLAARAAGRAGDFQAVVEIAEHALAAPGLSSSWRARIECWYTIVLLFTAPPDQSTRMAEDCLAHALDSGDPVSIAYARHAMYTAKSSDATAQDLAQAAAALGDDAESADLRLMLSTNYDDWRHETSADPVVREKMISDLLVLAEQMSAGRAANPFVTAANHCFQAGRWDETLGYLVRIDPEIAAMSPHADDFLGIRILIHWLRGDLERAAGELAQLDPALADPTTDPDAPKVNRRWVCIVRAVAAELAGDLAGAHAALAAGVMNGPNLLYDVARFEETPELIRLGLLAGDLKAAGQAVRALEDFFEATPVPPLAATLEHARALVAGDPVALLAAADTLGSVGWVLRQGAALEEAAVLFAQAGQADRARAALNDAVDCYNTPGAVVLVRRAESRLRELGVRRGPRSRHRRASSGWAALTPTERKVAELLGRGLSNPEIAGQLFLSRYTVQSHVSRILAKLGFASRVDVIRAFSEGRLPGPGEGGGPES